MNAPSSDGRFAGKSYRIERSVTDAGNPLYMLYEDRWLNTYIFGLVSTSNLLAANRDRRVLEQAITFLESGE